MSSQVTVYTTRFCGYCTRAMSLLDKRGIPYDQVSLDGNHDKRVELTRQTGWRTVPMIFVAGEFVGGADDLQKLDRSGELEKMLR